MISSTNHNVYILGAGFSRLAGIPLVRGFLNCMRLSAPWLENQGRKEELDAVQKVLEFRLDSSAAAERMPIDLENVEELFSLASTLSVNDHARSIVHAIAATIDYASSCEPPARGHREVSFAVPVRAPVDSLPKHWGSRLASSSVQDSRTNTLADHYTLQLPEYDWQVATMLGLFSGLDGGTNNTFISFNYDLVLERTLTSLGIPFTYHVASGVTAPPVVPQWGPSATPVSLLKLHGSVNWIKEKLPGVALRAVNSYEDVRRLAEMPFLVPPTWRKQFDGELTGVWDHAVQAISRATRIFIVGYSMPDADPHFRYLMASGLRQNSSLNTITIVNNDEKRMKTVVPRVFRSELEERGILHMIGTTCDGFLGNPLYVPLISRPRRPPFG